MHWVDLNKMFSQLYRFLKPGAEVVTTSACHYYGDPNFPASEWSARHNDFVKYGFDEVYAILEKELGRAPKMKHYTALAQPKHTLDSISKISKDNGFETEQVATYFDYHPILQLIIPDVFPALVREAVQENQEALQLENVIAEAVRKTITNPKALKDTQRCYDIVPVFSSVRN